MCVGEQGPASFSSAGASAGATSATDLSHTTTPASKISSRCVCCRALREVQQPHTTSLPITEVRLHRMWSFRRYSRKIATGVSRQAFHVWRFSLAVVVQYRNRKSWAPTAIPVSIGTFLFEVVASAARSQRTPKIHQVEQVGHCCVLWSVILWEVHVEFSFAPISHLNHPAPGMHCTAVYSTSLVGSCVITVASFV